MTGSAWQTPVSSGARYGVVDEAGPAGVLGGRAAMWENWSSLASSKVIEILQNFFFLRFFFFTVYTIFTINSFVLVGAVLGLCCCTQAFSSCGARASLTVDLGL